MKHVQILIGTIPKDKLFPFHVIVDGRPIEPHELCMLNDDELEQVKVMLAGVFQHVKEIDKERQTQIDQLITEISKPQSE